MKSLKAVLFILVSLVLIATVSANAIDKDEYITSVINILRTHVSLLEELSAPGQCKYSTNLVRHASAVEHTFGLLGPMEWHASDSATIRGQAQGTSSELDEEMFERLARKSKNALKGLTRAAHDSMEEHDQDAFLDAIQTMKESCDNCHSLLPKEVAPDVWGPIDRK